MNKIIQVILIATGVTMTGCFGINIELTLPDKPKPAIEHTEEIEKYEYTKKDLKTINVLKDYIAVKAPTMYGKQNDKIAKLIYLNSKILFKELATEISYLMVCIMEQQTSFREELSTNDGQRIGSMHIRYNRVKEIVANSKRIEFIGYMDNQTLKENMRTYEVSIIIAAELLHQNSKEIKKDEKNLYRKYYNLIKAYSDKEKTDIDFITRVMNEYYEIMKRGDNE